MPLIYCGPSVTKWGLRKNQTFYDGLPENVRAVVVNNRDVDELIVPVEDFIKINERIKISGSRENLIYKKLEKGAGISA